MNKIAIAFILLLLGGCERVDDSAQYRLARLEYQVQQQHEQIEALERQVRRLTHYQ